MAVCVHIYASHYDLRKFHSSHGCTSSLNQNSIDVTVLETAVVHAVAKLPLLCSMAACHRGVVVAYLFISVSN